MASLVAVAAGYYLGAVVGLALRLPPTLPSVFWPPNAVLTAALLLSPPRRWILYLLAAFPGHLIAESHAGWELSLIGLIYLSNCSEALIAAGVVRLLSDAPDRFDTLPRFGIFVGGVVVAAPLLSTFPDAAVVHWTRGDPYWNVWTARFLSNVLAALTVTPAILAVFSGARGWIRSASRRHRWETATVLLSLVVVSLLILGYPMQSALISDMTAREPFVVLLPIMLWTAVRFGPNETSLTLLSATLLVTWLAAHAAGPFASMPPAETVIALQLVLISVSVPLLGLAAVIAERAQTQEALKQRLDFEELLSQVSRAFVQIPSSMMAPAFAVWLKKIGEFLQIERLILFGISDDLRDLRVVAKWVAPGANDLSDVIVRRDFPWTLDRLLDRQTVVVDDAARFASTAPRDAESMQAVSCETFVAVPLVAGDKPVGALSFSAHHQAQRTWSDAIVSRLELVAEVFANALARKRSEDTLQATELDAQRMRTELAHFTRVSTMGELTAALAHQLSQPLTGILSNAQAARRMLAHAPADLGEIGSILTDIVADDRRAGEVIDRMRELLRKDDAVAVPLEVNDLIRDVTRFVASEAIIRSVRIELDLSTESMIVRGDRVQLQQVVLNLVQNAIDALVDADPPRRWVGVRSLRTDSGIHVLVADAGRGFDPGAVDAAFEPFYTTKPTGMGMGLAIARSIVEAHGGSIHAQNAPEGGAIVEFTLPRVDRSG